MKIVFFGTPQYVLPILKALHKEYNWGREQNLIGVVTQSPKQAGRKKFIERSPVDNWAYKHGISVAYKFSDIPEADLGILAAYGKIVPKEVLAKFKHGILNVHPSLLPKYRGASPIQAAIANGDEETGVSVIRMDEELDHGEIVSQFREEILPHDTNETLRARLFLRASEFLIGLIPKYVEGKVELHEQNHEEASYTNILRRDDGFVDIKEIFDPVATEKVYNKYRAMYPWPGIWTTIEVKDKKMRLKIIKMHIDNKVVLDEVQLEGKKELRWEEFLRGYPDAKLGL